MSQQLKYRTVEEAYNKEFNRLVTIARSRLINQDFAIDCVHDAFAKRLEYFNRNKDRMLSGYYLIRDVCRAAEHYNNRNRIESYYFKDLNDDVQQHGRCISGRILPITNYSKDTFDES